MNISVHLRLVVPVGMRILLRNHTFLDYIFQMALPAVPPLVGGQPVEHGLVRGLLQIHVERGVHLQAAFMDLVGPVLAFQIAANFFHKIGRQRIGIVRQVQNQGGRSRVGGLCGRYLAVFQHGVDHQIPPLLRAIGMVDRGVHRRALRQTREQGGFLERQVFAGLLK